MTAARVQLPRRHPGQQRVRKDEARFTVLMCGRRWGKTEYGIIDACERVLEGQRVGWFAPTYKVLDEAWRRLDGLLSPVVSRRRADLMRLETVTGGAIDCWSLDKPDAGRGRKYHRAVVDEAGIVRNLQEAWTGAIRPTLTDYKGSALFPGTPKGRGEFYRLFAKGEQGDPGWASFRLPTLDNPHIDPDEVEAARKDLPAQVFAQEFEGIPADDGGNPFGLDAIAECVGPLSNAEPVAWGIDLAKSQDWTVAIGLDNDGCVCRYERWQSQWGATEARLLGMIRDTPALVDSTGVGDPVVENMQRRARRVEGFKFTAPSKQQLMEGLAAAIHKREIRFPDGEIRRELEVFEYEYTRTGVRYSAPDGLHDDCVCALALAVRQWNELRHRPQISFGGFGRSVERDRVGGLA